MKKISFEGVGTRWKITVEDEAREVFKTRLEKKIKRTVENFEKRFSRFLEKSEVGKINNDSDKDGREEREYRVSDDFLEMVKIGERLFDLTEGRFSLGVTRFLEKMGYGGRGNKGVVVDVGGNKRDKEKQIFERGGKLVVRKGAKIDIGSVGKGFLIDKLAKILEDFGMIYFLIDGGGDLYGTSKSDRFSWQVALEHPEKENRAIGTVKIKNGALAGSGSGKRKFGKAHHLLEAINGLLVDEVLGVFVESKTAFVADAVATAIFVSNKDCWERIGAEMKAEWLVLKKDLSLVKSKRFKGEVFVESMLE